jgi:hypothetical protein
MTIVDSPDAKNDAVLVRRHPAGRVRGNMRTNKVVQPLLQLRAMAMCWSVGHDAPSRCVVAKSRLVVRSDASGRWWCWASMARYFFHLTNGDNLADEVGEEFECVEAAQRHAMAMARELSGSRRPDALVRHHISVVDERGVEVFKVPV